MNESACSTSFQSGAFGGVCMWPSWLWLSGGHWFPASSQQMMTTCDVPPLPTWGAALSGTQDKKLTPVDIIWQPLVLPWGGHKITYAVLQPWGQRLNLVTRKQQTNPEGETFSWKKEQAGMGRLHLHNNVIKELGQCQEDPVWSSDETKKIWQLSNVCP